MRRDAGDSGWCDRLIAVDLSPPVGPRAKEDFGLSVSGWKALRAQLGRRRSQFPGLVAMLMRAMVAGSVRDRDRMLADGTVDWYLDLDLRGVGLLDFERVAEVAERGYEARPAADRGVARGGASDLTGRRCGCSRSVTSSTAACGCSSSCSWRAS